MSALATPRLRPRPEKLGLFHTGPSVASPVGLCSACQGQHPPRPLPLPTQRRSSPPTDWQAGPELVDQGSRGHKPKGSHKDQFKNNPLVSIIRRSLQRSQVLRAIRPTVMSERLPQPIRGVGLPAPTSLSAWTSHCLSLCSPQILPPSQHLFPLLYLTPG